MDRTTTHDETARLVALGLDGDAARRHARTSTTTGTAKGTRMNPHDQLDLVVPALVQVARAVEADQLDERTPCAAFAVRDVFDHMTGAAAFFTAQFRGDAAPTPRPPAVTDDGPAAALVAALEDLHAATKTPGALDRTIESPFGAVPGDFAARYLALDGTVHTWDLAQATGQTFEPSDALIAEILAFAPRAIAPALRDGDTFAAEVAPAAGATSLERLVAFTGRTIRPWKEHS